MYLLAWASAISCWARWFLLAMLEASTAPGSATTHDQAGRMQNFKMLRA